MTDQETSTSTSESGDQKLWAGKYKSPEDLETAYNNIRKTHSENEQLKTELEKIRSVPDEYIKPDNIVLPETALRDINELARRANLNQEYYEKLVQSFDDRHRQANDSYEAKKKEIGEDKIVILKDYVTKIVPAKLQNIILDNLIQDKEAMTDALKHRDQLLNSQVPGMNKGSTSAPNSYDGQKELRDMAKEFVKSNDPRLKDKLIGLAREVGDARFKK